MMSVIVVILKLNIIRRTNFIKVKIIMKKITKIQLKNFDFRFIRHVTRDLYEIIDGKKYAKMVNASRANIFGDEILFWSDDCIDGTNRIKIKDILSQI